MRENLLKRIQSRVLQVEHEHFQELSRNSQDEAVKVSLLLSNAERSMSRAPEFDLNPKYRNADILADAINELLKRVDDTGSDNSFDLASSHEDAAPVDSSSTVSESEMARLCKEWKTNYNVITGVSWGELTYDLQQKWTQYSCDVHNLNSQ
jgi:hypothetical protein